MLLSPLTPATRSSVLQLAEVSRHAYARASCTRTIGMPASPLPSAPYYHSFRHAPLTSQQLS
jgi:hypothetical protein